MTMRFAPLAHLRSTQPNSHLQEYSAADELDAAVARGEQFSSRAAFPAGTTPFPLR
jgi:hypothetical protein